MTLFAIRICLIFDAYPLTLILFFDGLSSSAFYTATARRIVMKYLLAALVVALATIQVASAQQGPPQTNYLDQLQCNFNPEGCRISRRGQEQNATYQALREAGATEKEAVAGAMTPQYLQALLPALEARRQNAR
jgi:hypothetical protein